MKISRPPSCPAKYAEAAKRHWQDAEILFLRDRKANADQLYGLAAECAIKALLVSPMLLGSPDLDRKFKIHMNGNNLWIGFQALAKGRGKHFSLLDENCPYNNWFIDQRYCADGTIEIDRIHARRQWTGQIMEVLKYSETL
ncbi:MAG: hypothetical protein HQL76_14375 [Magnetococcales bacterium]|nr:hypothetical protein [Magnetococcales bacterium]